MYQRKIHVHIHIYIYIYIYIYTHTCITCIHIPLGAPSTANLHTKILGVRGFDTSRILLLRGGYVYTYIYIYIEIYIYIYT